MNKNEYILSIVIPIYNGEKFLHQTLNTLIRQLNNNIEVVLIDDGSVDDSLSICKQYQNKYNNFVIYSQSNSGICQSRNLGIKKANGKYIIFIDQDDKLLDSSLNNLIDAINQYKTNIVIASKIFTEIDENGDIIKRNIYQYSNDKIDDKNRILNLILNFNNDCIASHIWNCIYDREFLIDNNIMFDSYFKMGYEDLAFNIEVIYKSEKVGISSKIVYEYMRNANTSTSKKINVNIYQDNFYLLSKIYNILKSDLIELVRVNDFILFSIRTMNSCYRASNKYINKSDLKKYIEVFFHFVNSLRVKNNKIYSKPNINRFYFIYLKLENKIIQKNWKKIYIFLLKFFL